MNSSLVLLCADRVVTGVGRTVYPDGAVLVSGASIGWVGPRGSAPDTPARRVNLDGATLLPGLIDAHTHLALDAGPDPFGALGTLTDHQVLAAMRERAGRMLAVGITTARDLGAPARMDTVLAREIRNGHAHGPRLLTAGIPVTRPGGHGAPLGGECAGPDDAEALVRANQKAGAQWTKVFVTGGFTTKGTSPYALQLPVQFLAAVTALSHRLGMKVAVHAHATAGIAAAVEAGVDSIEHCTWMSADGFDLDPELITTMAALRIVASTTVNSHARDATGRLPWTQRAAQLRALHDHGVPLAVGTDAGIPTTAHDDLPASLPAYLDLGLDPLGVLELATSRTAKALGLHDTGALHEGMRADVLAVEGDPTADLSALTRPLTVLAAGTTHPTVPARKATHP
ncbi:amidohydrolase family protein [Streptomyces sp. NPDC021096]|uniref:amidohydrolase family protein n=1 Tax=Streptomyces sp. NPDC021096 TaxID=3154792 RepID=UPI0033DC5EAA